MIQTTTFSPCRHYRYTLARTWDQSLGQAMFLCLNPSTADEVNNDPTVTRCINYAKDWGYGSFLMTNIFAYRSTDPRGLRTVSDPVGEENNDWLVRAARDASIVVCGWGNHGDYLYRSSHVKNLLSPITELHYLKLTGKGEPGHPLYLRADLKPVRWL